MDNEDQVSRDLQRHLDEGPVGYLSTKSGADIRVLKHLLTPEEAKIATQLSTIKMEPVKTIYRYIRKSGMSMSIKELQKNWITGIKPPRYELW